MELVDIGDFFASGYYNEHFIGFLKYNSLASDKIFILNDYGDDDKIGAFYKSTMTLREFVKNALQNKGTMNKFKRGVYSFIDLKTFFPLVHEQLKLSLIHI